MLSPDDYTEPPPPPTTSPAPSRDKAAGTTMDYSFNIIYNHAKLTPHFYATIMGEGERKAMWVREACALYESFLQDVLLMESEKINDALDGLEARLCGKCVSSNPDESLVFVYTDDKDACYEIVDLTTPVKKSMPVFSIADSTLDSLVDKGEINQRADNNVSVVDLCESTDASMLSACEGDMTVDLSNSMKDQGVGDKTVDFLSSMEDDDKDTNDKNPEVVDLSKDKQRVNFKRPSSEMAECPAKKARQESTDVLCTPVNKTRRPSKPNQVLHIKCESKCRVWHGRNKARKQVRQKHPEITDSLDFEIKVSDFQHEQVPSMPTVQVQFETSVLFSNDILCIELQPMIAVKEFGNLFTFIQPLLTRIIEQSLYKPVKP